MQGSHILSGRNLQIVPRRHISSGRNRFHGRYWSDCLPIHPFFPPIHIWTITTRCSRFIVNPSRTQDLFKLFRTLLVNTDTREAAKTYLQEVIARNVKRTQMQPDEKQVAGSCAFPMKLLFRMSQRVFIKVISRNSILPFKATASC